MKKLYAFLLPLLLLSSLVSAQTLYWVGPDNGSFNNSANWSATSGGAGGAGSPGATNDLVFDRNAVVNVPTASNQVNSVLVTNNSLVKLYTATNTQLTVTSGNTTTPGLRIDAGSTLKDSTAADVAFDFRFPAGSLGAISGSWEFEGQVPPTSGGAGFTVLSTGVVNVSGTVNFRENTNNIDVDNQANINFGAGSFYILNKDEAASVPDVTYHTNSTILVLGSVFFLPGFEGTSPSYGNVVFNLPSLATSESLGFSNSTVIKGNLEFLNTNNQTLNILANLNNVNPTLTAGNLLISGANTRVALAEENLATAAAGGRLYTLQVTNFTQTGGDFSLQQANSVINSSILAVSGNFSQTGGTFDINSTATSTGVTDLFVIEMNGTTAQTISILDNTQNELTLRIDNGSGGSVSLLTPLSVARLDLASGVLTTTVGTPANIITVSDPSADYGIKNASAASYVNGALRRATNAVDEYLFPTGKGGIYDSVVIIPATTSGSVFEAEYFNAGYPDESVQNPPLAGVANNEYWTVARVSGADNAQIRLALNAAVPRSTSSHTIVVARYNGTDWESEQGASGTSLPGDATTGTVTSDVQSVFGPYTFGIAGAAALPIHLLSFEVKKQNNGAALEWKTEDLPVSFEVLRSTDGSNYSKIGTVRGVAGTKTYRFFDNNLQVGVNYYRLRSVEIDGAISYSKVVAVINKESGVEITTLAPNLVVDRTKLSISAARGGRMEIIITDMSGRAWRKFVLTVSPGNTDNYLSLGDLAAGVYHITGYMNGEKTSTLRLIKQ
jgi:hypothetical protein